VQNRYLWGAAVDQLLADEAPTYPAIGDPTANTRWALLDHQNSIRDLVDFDESDGSVDLIDHVIYQAFGQRAGEGDPDIASLFGYTGRLFDQQTDLQYNSARWYDAALMQWLSEDPIGFAAGDPNPRRYVGNDPVNKVDPSGLAEGLAGRLAKWRPAIADWFSNEVTNAAIEHTMPAFVGDGVKYVADRTGYRHAFNEMNVRPMANAVLAHGEQILVTREQVKNFQLVDAFQSNVAYVGNWEANSMVTQAYQLYNPATRTAQAQELWNGVAPELVGTVNDVFRTSFDSDSLNAQVTSMTLPTKYLGEFSTWLDPAGAQRGLEATPALDAVAMAVLGKAMARFGSVPRLRTPASRVNVTRGAAFEAQFKSANPQPSGPAPSSLNVPMDAIVLEADAGVKIVAPAQTRPIVPASQGNPFAGGQPPNLRPIGPRAATRQPIGGNGLVLADGQGASRAELAASIGGPSGGSRSGQSAVRVALIQQQLQENNGVLRCWRCGATSTNPADFHVGHRNVPTSLGGNLAQENVVLEGAACNLSAGNRGTVLPGRSCIDRGGPGAPYGRFTNGGG
jgi:RHS repeat-associated protein